MAKGWKQIAEGDIIGGVLNVLKGAFDSTFGAVLASIKGFVDGAIKLFVGFYNRLVGHSIIPDLVRDIQAAFAIDWLKLGQNVTQGIEKGISAGISSLVATAGNAARQAYQAAQNALQSHSPSKLFEDLGLGTQVGMARGIMKGAGMPAMAALGAVGGMAMASAQSVPVVTPAPRVVVQGGSTTVDRRVNVNANYAATQSPARIIDDLQLANMLQGA